MKHDCEECAKLTSYVCKNKGCQADDLGYHIFYMDHRNPKPKFCPICGKQEIDVFVMSKEAKTEELTEDNLDKYYFSIIERGHISNRFEGLKKTNIRAVGLTEILKSIRTGDIDNYVILKSETPMSNGEVKLSIDWFEGKKPVSSRVCPECGETFLPKNKDDVWCNRCENDRFSGGARTE